MTRLLIAFLFAALFTLSVPMAVSAGPEDSAYRFSYDR